MKDRFRRIFWITAAVHLVAVFILMTGSFLSSCKKPNKPQEVVTFIDFESPVAEPLPVVEVESITPPEPTPPPPKPKVIPVPKPKPIPPPKPKKKVIKKSKKRIKRDAEPEPPKKKTQPVNRETIRNKMLDGAVTKRASLSQHNDFPFAWYFSLVRRTMYEAWEQPGSLSATSGLRARVLIRVQKNGSITKRELERSSGNSLMDNSVMKAVRSVTKLEPLPAKYNGAYRDITVEFDLADG